MKLKRLILITAVLYLGVTVAVAQSPPASSAQLRYKFTKGQKINIKWEESSNDVEENLIESTRTPSQETKGNSILLEVLEVTPAGDATIALKFDAVNFSRSIGPGLMIVFDTQRSIAESNAELARLGGAQAKPILDKLESFRQVMTSAFLGSPIRLTVNNQGKVTSVTGVDVIWDKYREEVVKIITDKAKRAELDSIIEGLFGEGAINKLFSFSLFIPYPAEAINIGKEWNDQVEFEAGPIRLPVKRNFKLASAPTSTQPLQITGTMEFGKPAAIKEVEITIPRNIIQDDVTVDAKTGVPIKRVYGGRLEMEAHAPSPDRKPLMRITMDMKGSVVVTQLK